MSSRKQPWWRRRLGKDGRERGMVEAGIAAAGGLLVVGAVVGNGVAASIMDMSDGQTWLPENDGSVVQINPATGQPEYRLLIGDDGERMEVTQSDGFLVVTNLDTGVVTPIDLTGLLVGQGRQTEGETVVLIGGGLMVLAELEPGLVQVIDPFTAASMGSPYRAGEDLSDVVIDREGTVWLVTDSGSLRELDWVASAGEFSVSLDRPIAAAGPGTRLVPHDAGVTVFAPDGGAVLQIGAGGDIVQQVPSLQGEVMAAAKSPADLAPASATDLGLVFMISGRELLTVDVGGLDCTKPLTPAVFERRVYVPCGGEGRVVVLDEKGYRAGADILVPGGGDPTLIVDDGRLIVHDPDDGRIVLVQQDGSSQVTDLNGAEVPTIEADDQEPLPPISVTNPTTPVSPPTQDPIDIRTPGTTDPPTDRPTDGPTDGPTDNPTDRPTDDPTDGPTSDGGGTPGPGDADLAPTRVTATLQGDDSVRVTWRAPAEQPTAYLVTSSDGAVSQWLGAQETEASVTGLTCGTAVTITVYAQHAGDRMVGAPADVDTRACVNPPEPGQLTPSGVVAQRADDDVVVGWTAPEIAPERYVVTGMGLTQTVDGGATSTVFADVACGDPIRFEVTAVHPDAGEYAATSAAITETCPVDPADLQPRDVVLSGGGEPTDMSWQATLTWRAPVIAPVEYRITGSGVNATMPASATTWSGSIACATSARLTVTAIHADDTESGARSNQLTQPCGEPTPTTTEPTTTTATLTAPTNVTASRQDVDTVRVTWSASSPAGDEYVVIPSSGGSVSTSGTSVNIDVTPGASYTFTVEARWQGQTATSAASNSVNMPAPATVPAAPSNARAHVEHQVGFVTNSASWTAPSDGGSPITGYQLIWDGRVINLGPGQTSWSEQVPCNPCREVIELPDFDVSVSATNSIGQGPAAHATPTAGGTPTLPVPQNGDSVISIAGTGPVQGPVGEEGLPWSVTYTPPAAWANFTGTCTVHVSGMRNVTQVVACGSSSTIVSGEAIHGGSISAYATAVGGGVNATSATESGWIMGRNDVGWCSVSPRICYPPVSLPLDDPDVDVDPLPWQPPDVPNPPVLVAGVGMLLGAGTLKTLRALRRRGLIETPSERVTTEPNQKKDTTR